MRSVWLAGVLWALSCTALAEQTHRALEGHQVVRIYGENLGPLLAEALTALPALDVLHQHGRQEARVRVARGDVEAFKDMSDRAKLHYVVEVEDLADYLRKHDLEQELTASSRIDETCDETGCSKPPKNYFMTFTQMEWYMRDLAASHPSRVRLSSLGKSVEGRDIWMVNVLPAGSNSSDGNSTLSSAAIWFEGGLHAREWISSSSTIHLLDKIATACENHCDLNYYFVPMANPDGYEYSRTVNRMWRKNRADISQSCAGVDLNRNWDYKYGVGASSDPCSETFKGPSAFSEPETRFISEAMSKVGNFNLMITFHSYGQSILYPWGWTTKPTPDRHLLVRAGTAFADAVQRTTGQTYKVANSAAGLYFAAGATDDWTKKVLEVPYTYTVELRDAGDRGFLLPASEIAPTAKEVIAGVSALISAIREM